MKIRRAGKCVVCHVKVIQHQIFNEQSDIFGGTEGITKKIRFQILAWRNKPILCDEHADVNVTIKRK